MNVKPQGASTVYGWNIWLGFYVSYESFPTRMTVLLFFNKSMNALRTSNLQSHMIQVRLGYIYIRTAVREAGMRTLAFEQTSTVPPFLWWFVHAEVNECLSRHSCYSRVTRHPLSWCHPTVRADSSIIENVLFSNMVSVSEGKAHVINTNMPITDGHVEATGRHKLCMQGGLT